MSFKPSTKSNDHCSIQAHLTSNTAEAHSSINSIKDTSSLSKSTSISTANSKGKDQLSSSNLKKLRLSGNSAMKDTNSMHNRRKRSLRDSREIITTQRSSSSSKSTESETVSESDSDLSGSSSISSSSDSNSSQSSCTSSLSNSCEKGFVSKIHTDSPKMNFGHLKSTESHSLKKSSQSEDPKLTTTQSLRDFKVSCKSSAKGKSSTFRSHAHLKDDRLHSLGLSNSVSHKTTKIHVGNLTRNILRSHLQEIFSNYGKIRRLDLPLDSISGFNQGYSYIDYDSYQSATDALNFMDDGFLDGQLISVQLTYPLPRTDDVVRRRKSPKYSPNRRNWSPNLRRKLSSEYRRTRSPLSRRAPARFQRRKRRESISSSRSRTRSLSPRSRSTGKRHSTRHTSNVNYRKYSRSSSSQRFNNIYSTTRRSYRNNRHASTSSSYSTSSESL